jgi:acyl-CoA thioesterase-1
MMMIRHHRRALHLRRAAAAAVAVAAVAGGCERSEVPAPIAVLTHEVAVPALQHPDGPVVILGASYAAGWHPELDGRQVINRGVSGEESWQCLARFEADVVRAQPRAVVIWGFINDIFRSPKDRIGPTLERTRASLQQMVRSARERGIEPIVATEVTVRPTDSWRESLSSLVNPILGRSSYQDYINGHVHEINRWLRGVAEAEKVLLLDVHGALSTADGVRRRAFAAADGSHISDAGYAALRAYADPILRRHLEREASHRSTPPRPASAAAPAPPAPVPAR